MDPAILKKIYEELCATLTDNAKFTEMLEMTYATVQKIKAGGYDIVAFENDMKAEMVKKGKTDPVDKAHVEKMFALLSQDKVKVASKEELSVLLKARLETQKAEMEAAFKK